MCPNGNADLTRNLILNAAISIISKDGLDALTAGRLIDQAGISKGGLYHHFRTMAEVESEVLELLTQNITLKISSYPTPATKNEFLEIVEQELFECFIVNNEPARALFGFISASANNKTIQVLMRRLMDEISLQRLQQLKAVSPGVAHVTLHNTVQIISTLQMGLMTRFFIAEDVVSLKSYWRGCRGMLEELLGLAGQSIEQQGTIEIEGVTDILKYQ